MEMLRLLIGPDNGDATTAQICARAILLFPFGILCIRIAGRRTFSQYSPLDIIVAIIIGSNVSRMMTGRSSFVSSIAATLLLVILHRLVAMLAQGAPWLGRIIKGRPITLIRNGEIDERSLRWHAISHDDLKEALRLEQATNADQVALATLEGGGKISVIRKKG